VVRPSAFAGIDRRLHLAGLKNADVLFYKVPGTKIRFVNTLFNRGLNEAEKCLDTNVPSEDQGNGKVLVRNITGSLMIAWGEFEPYKYVYEWK